MLLLCRAQDSYDCDASNVRDWKQNVTSCLNSINDPQKWYVTCVPFKNFATRVPPNVRIVVPAAAFFCLYV